MSDMPQSANPAAVVEAEAALWLERRHFGQWSDADQVAFDEWASQSSANLLAYWRLDTTWQRAGRLVVLDAAPGAVSSREPKWRSRFLRAAVLTCGIVGASIFGASYFAPPSITTYTTSIGERKILKLPDGSKIELNTNSVLRMSSDNKRQAWLDKGEAFFQIVHNAAAPFQVIASGHRVTDLGTTFTIRSEKDRIEVSLLEGRARLASLDANVQEHSTILIPGDVLVATPTSLSVSKQPERSLKEALGWRRGVLVFDHATLAEAVAEFNRYNRTKLIVADENAASRTIGATFPVHDVELFARVAEQVLGLRATHQNGNIVISQ